MTMRRGVAVDSSGNVYLTGTTVDPNVGDDDTFVVKLDGAGNLVKRVTIGGEGNDDGYGIAVDSTGAVYVVGGSDSVQWQISTNYAGARHRRLLRQNRSHPQQLCLRRFLRRYGTDVGLLLRARFLQQSLLLRARRNRPIFKVTRTAAQTHQWRRL